MHVDCCMRDTVYYVQIHDTEVRVINFNQRKDIIYKSLAYQGEVITNATSHQLKHWIMLDCGIVKWQQVPAD
jgi:hypothetical protein